METNIQGSNWQWTKKAVLLLRYSVQMICMTIDLSIWAITERDDDEPK